MFIQEVIIDGFKSYATRTVISGWDPEFSAITGLNGSGKSNILDAICFVLGISNLSQVRASNLQELVYKQGQAGVTKATVSIVFNNSDPKQSPIGYEHVDTITVTRQVVIGGRNKYLINGKNAQASTVANMFHSVQLNVNNPHFLIMQGRITKVLNMKPAETLGMIEEAAGTRMFEAKKQAALKTIEKKQTKVEEINKVLAEDITPTLEKLRGERTAYLRWAANNTECERLARFCVAYEYVTADKGRDKAKADAKAEDERSASEAARALTAKATAASKEAEIRAAEAARSAASGGDFARLTAREEGASRDLTKAEVAAASRRGALREEEKGAKAAAKAADEAAAAVASLTASLAAHRADASAAGAASEAAASEVSSLMNKVNAAAAGMAVDDGPAGGGAGGGTFAEQLLAAKARVSALSSDINTGELKVKHLRSVAKDLAGAGKAAEAEARANEGALAKAQKALADKQAKLAGSGFNVSEDEGLRGRREAVMGELAARGDALESEGASLSHLVDFTYDAGALGGPSGAARVKGVLATLLKVTRPDAATALEVGGGSKLFQVVVDDEVTGKALLERGRLARRVTFIPLSHIRRGRLSDAQVAAARRVAGSPDAVWPALELVSYPPEIAPAVEYALGGFFVAKDAATAKAVTFDPSVRAPCVSLEGDMFDPAGTLEGGSKPEAGRDGGGVPTLVRIGRLVAERRAVEGLRAELAALDAKLKASASASAAYAALAAEAELAAHDVKLLTSRIATSQAGATAAKAAETAAALAAAEAALAEARAALGGAKERVTALEAEGRNVAAAREERVKALEKALAASKKAAAAAEKKAKDAARAVDACAAELEAAQVDAAKAAAAHAAAGEAVKRAAADLDAAEAEAAKLRAVAEAARAELDAARSALAAADKAVKGLTKERDAAVKEAEDAEAEAKRAAARAKDAAKEATACERAARDLADKHPWIATERQFFGRAHTDYDFGARDPTEALARLKALEKQQGDLERRINKKVIGMIESAEREYADLVAKKRIIENDKAKINKVITELDEKKNEALRTTWAKVNKDFGSIFGTLLPGVTARLDPDKDGAGNLTGLSVRVAFNGVWKESLLELSGGQRSLLALSLILALLLFKPAPMYILDEVDAALDLSHTQNIGHMIRTHFSASQFIVVSLKQGMFSNANVIFRTKFVEGVGSTVTRTVPSPGEGGGAGKHAAALEDGDAKENGAAGGKARKGAAKA